MVILFELFLLTINTGYFIGFLCLCSLFILWFTRGLPEGYGLAEIPEGHVDQWTVHCLKQKELDLLRVREERKWLGWWSEDGKWFVPALPNEWQLKAAILKPLALEIFFIKEVWGAYGHQYEIYRYEMSEMKEMLLNAEKLYQDEETPILLT